ncbi:MAG: hypothetical protein LCH56_16040 [Proteobacteria bacterium]|nr:hypothetical protein [Pseudomonadota bacterium]
MRAFKHVAFLALAGLIVAAPVRAQEREARQAISEEAVAFFGGLCITTRGAPSRIERVIADRQIKAVPLSPEGVQTLLDGKPGDSGWVVLTNQGAELQLLAKAPSTCTLRVLDSYGDVVNAVMADLLKGLSTHDGFAFRKAMDETRSTNGGDERLVGYFLNWRDGGWSGALSVSHIDGDGKDIPPQTFFSLEMRQTS